MVVSSSYDYPMANVIGGVALSLPISLILTPFIGGLFWIGSRDMWLFLGLFAVLFIIFHEVIKRTNWLKRIFISQKEVDEEVEEAAIINFFNEGLYRTRDETGILIFISVFEHRVWVLADRGINQKVKPGQWDEIVRLIIEGIKQKRQAEAICEAIQEVGDMLKEHFPIKPDDRDELKNIIVKDE
jgi:putative membrane protein